jgi:murein DD-endopeptidase MepM/ murein hydrolase activator NlpD
MNTRTGLLAAVAAVALLCGLPILTVLADPPAAGACGRSSGVVGSAGLRSHVGPIGDWSSTQIDNAAIIVGVGANTGIPPRGWVIAVATAMQESSLTNSPVATDHDSVGLFQQRPSQGWGTVAQLTDPVYASGKFYDALLTVPHWQSLPLTEAAQAVQRSAYPDAYAQWEHDAETVVAAVAGVATITDLPGASLVACGTPPVVGSGGWTQPVHAPIVSGFRTPERPNHDGDDLGAPRYTIIRAAAAGRVVWSGCDNDTGNCDIDGSPQTRGCGWFVEILHTGDVATRYCHLVRRPDAVLGTTVAAGDPIGVVGTSGNSSGPHLHFEVHTSVTCGATRCALTRANAIDPNLWMRQVGAPLGD